MHARAFDAYILKCWLSDWTVPQLCREIRKIDPNAPIVFCTASTGDGDRRRATRAGASAYLCKPVDSEMLKSKLGALFTVADVASLQAKGEAEHAVRDELARRSTMEPSRS